MSVLLRTPATGLDMEATEELLSLSEWTEALNSSSGEKLQGVTCKDAASIACLFKGSALDLDL